MTKQVLYPAGHYYSPIPEAQDVLEHIKSRRKIISELADIDFKKESQFTLLQKYYSFYDEPPFTEKQSADSSYYYDQDWFCYTDAIFKIVTLTKKKRHVLRVRQV